MDENKKIFSFSKLPFLAILSGIYIFVWYLQLGGRIGFLGTIRFEFLFGATLLILALLSSSKTSSKKLNSDNLIPVAIFLVFILFLYTIFSYNRDHSTIVFIDRVLKFAAVSVFIYSFCRSTLGLKIFIAFMLLAWLKIGQEGFTGWLTGSMVWYNQGIPRLHGSTGNIAHPNSFSGFAVGTLPFIFYYLPVSKYKWQKAILLLMLFFAAIIILNTGSRTGYVATALFITYYVFSLNINKFKAAIIFLLIIVSVINWAPTDYKERFVSIYTGEEKEGNSSGTRKQILHDAWDVFLKYPYGVGVQAFPFVRMDMFGRYQDTHNLYMEILTNIGPWGLILFFIVIKKIIGLNIKCIKRNQDCINNYDHDELSDNTDRLFLIATSKAIIGFISVRLLLGLFGMDLYEIYWWLAIGLTLSINYITQLSDCSKKQTSNKV